MSAEMLADKHHLHVPVPGELVSPASGSALPTVARALGSALIDAGGQAGIIARTGPAHDAGPVPLLKYRTDRRDWLTRNEKAFDAASGAALDRRPFLQRLWTPVYDAVPVDHRGPVFLYNAPGAAAGLRGRRPLCRPVVYLQNEIARGWPARARQRLVDTTPVICVSRFVAERLLPGAADAGRVLTLINGADPAQFHPEEPAGHANPGPASPPTILFVGKVNADKGPDLLIRAALRLHAEGLPLRVRVVGGSQLSATDGLSDFERDLRALSAPLGDSIEFSPFVDRSRIADVYRDATIMVVPSNWDEPCALTLPEAMATGLACVSSRRGGLPEAGADAPLYFDPPDVGALTAALRRLLTDDAERRARARAARQRAAQLTWHSRLVAITEYLARWRPA